ncbi:MAG: cysteine desulfurase NifS [Acidobacteria bacterium]|nr:cysteine desulfurase NifS [Acidobacteriota bacterium]MCA1627593.1 cysteine desulfurase NifS [Acidobacteriota bacterium]
MIYLDNNATTQVAPEVLEAMQPYLSKFFGNPSSAHTLGREMKQAVERAREEVAELLGAADASEIVFTSCGSESDNWAIRGVLAAEPSKRHVITTQVEHEAVRNLCRLLENDGYEVTWLGVSETGELNLEELRSALRPDTALVSTMLANNETGVLFPIEEIGQIVRQRSQALFHVDGVQAVGKIAIDLKRSDVDLFALSGHKLHAPQGVGALYVRNKISLAPFIIGGAQEQRRRAGTLAVPNIVGLGAACRLAQYDNCHDIIEKLRNKLEDGILEQIPNARVNGTRDRAKRLPNTSNISFDYVEGQNILAHLDEAGICVSTGSACHSTTHESSATLRAMNVPYTTAQGSIRFSLGRYNTDADVETTLRLLPEIIEKLAAMSPYIP